MRRERPIRRTCGPVTTAAIRVGVLVVPRRRFVLGAGIADRLDAARTSTQGIALQAVPAIAKQLHDAIGALGQQSGEIESKMAELFGDV